MAEFLSVELHNEYARRMEEEHIRQNHRLKELEEEVKENRELLITVERIANSIENMQNEQKRQSEKLEELYSRDGNKWRKVSDYVLTALLGIAFGLIASQLGFNL